MAASPQSKKLFELQDLLQAFAFKSKESEIEIAARIEAEKQESEHRRTVEMEEVTHRRRLDYFVLGLLGCTSLVCFSVILTTRPPDDSSRLAWGTLTALLSVVVGYIAGRKAKQLDRHDRLWRSASNSYTPDSVISPGDPLDIGSSEMDFWGLGGSISGPGCYSSEASIARTESRRVLAWRETRVVSSPSRFPHGVFPPIRGCVSGAPGFPDRRKVDDHRNTSRDLSG
jgi:hypothetical protein